MMLCPFNDPVSSEKDSYEFLIKELNYLSLSPFKPATNDHVLCEPEHGFMLEGIRNVSCVYSVPERKLLADIMRLAKMHLIGEDGVSLIPGKVQSMKKYGYAITSFRDMSGKVNLAYFIETTHGAICFYATEEYRKYVLPNFPHPTTPEGYWSRAWKGLKLLVGVKC